MKLHSQSEVHLLSCQLDVEADKARREGSIIRWLQNVGEQQRLQNRKATNLLYCHIAGTLGGGGGGGKRRKKIEPA